MSLPEPRIESATRAVRRRLALGVTLLVLAAAAGCTVQPLYNGATSSTSAAPGTSMAASLASINVNQTGQGSNDLRVAQEVRNHLIFLLGGGAGQPADPHYDVSLRVTTVSAGSAVVQRTTRDEEPTAAVVTVRAAYTLSERSTGRTIASGLRLASASHDHPIQAFAALRAERDAQNRAAREVAEFLRLAIAQEIDRPRTTGIPVVVSTPGEIEDAMREDSLLSR